MRSRDVIAQAKGVLRERHGLDEAAAFGLLARRSQQTNVKVRELAEQILAAIGPSGTGCRISGPVDER